MKVQKIVFELSIAFLLLSTSVLAQVSMLSLESEAKYRNLLVQIGIGKHNKGYGFVVGWNDEKVNILTPRHVLEEYAKSKKLKLEVGLVVDVMFYRATAPSKARLKILHSKNSLDVALVEMEAPPSFQPQIICIAPYNLIGSRLPVWYLARRWSGDPFPGVIKRRNQGASYLIDISRLGDVDKGDSGGMVISNSGMVGWIEDAKLARGSVTVIDIHHLKAWVLKNDEKAWTLPLCEAAPIYSLDPSTCENNPNSYCWTRLAGDIFLTAPNKVDEYTSRKLGWLTGQQASLDEVKQLLEGVESNNKRFTILAAAAWGMSSSNKQGARLLADAASITAEKLKYSEKIEAFAELVGVYGALNAGGVAKNYSGKLKRIVGGSESFIQASNAYAKLAFFAFVGGMEDIAWESAKEMGVQFARSSKASTHKAKMNMADEFGDLLYYQAPFHKSQLIVAAVRLLSKLPPPTDSQSLETNRISLYYTYFIENIYHRIAVRKAMLGEFSAVLAIIRAEIPWWLENAKYSDDYYNDFAWELARAGLYDEAIQIAKTDLRYDKDPDWEEEIDDNKGPLLKRFAAEEVKTLSDIAEKALERRYPKAPAFFRSVRLFERENRFEYKTLPRGLYIAQIRRLCEANEPEEASAAYWDLLAEDVGIEVEKSRFDLVGIYVGKTSMKPKSELMLDAETANLIGVELPLMIAESFFRRDIRDMAEIALNISERFTNIHTFIIDENHIENEMKNLNKFPDIKRAQTLLIYLDRLAPNLFTNIDHAEARYQYGMTLIRMGNNSKGLALIGEAKKWNRHSREFLEELFVSYAAEGNEYKARQLFSKNSELELGFGGNQTNTFETGWTYAVARARRFDLMESAYNRIQGQAADADRNNLIGAISDIIIGDARTIDELKRAYAMINRIEIPGERLFGLIVISFCRKAISLKDDIWAEQLIVRHREDLRRSKVVLKYELQDIIKIRMKNKSLGRVMNLILLEDDVTNRIDLLIELAKL